MASEQNKTLVRRFLEDVWGKGNLSLIQQVVSPDVCDHNPVSGQPRGLEGQRWAVEMFRRACPDMKINVELLLGEGDYVVDHWTATGTQTGEMLGMPASGKRFSITGSDMLRFSDGKVDEIWHVEDFLTMLQQLGYAPTFPEQGRSSMQGATTHNQQQAMQGRRLSDDEKRSLTRRAYSDFIDKADLRNVDQYLTPDFVGHYSGGQTVHGLEEFKRYLEGYHTAFPKNHAEIEQIVVDGDLAAARITFIGTNSGPLLAFPPSGKQVKTNQISIARFVGDKVAEQWANNDDVSMLQQIGAMPMPEMAPAVPC